ncbi:MAG: 5-formyltetrahydrofolate cyclo-ligase [Nitriliruptorales bacterium]|nr:5-formyltetrahydrofolate cyclo-ligase [Nitriliruptorales bacterium]
MATATQAEKARLRLRLRAARSALPATTRAAWSAGIIRRLAALPELAGGQAVLAYAAAPSEVDLDGWMRAHLGQGGRLYLPRVRGDDLEVLEVRDLDHGLRPGWRGVREPRAGGGVPPLDPGVVEAAIVPGVAFDRFGGRLGQGGGHMDRLLARLPHEATVIGVAFSVQFLGTGAGVVPMEEHDVRVDVVVTEQQVLRPC